MRSTIGQALAGVTALIVLGGVAGCAGARDRSAAASAPEPSGSVQPAGGRDTEVFVQVLRRYLGTPAENSFPDRTFQHVFVLDRTVPGSGSPDARPAGGEPIPDGTQRAIAGALTDVGPVSFVADRKSVITTKDGCDVVKDGGILVTLAPVSGAGDRVEVGVNGFVACLGATWLTYVVQYTAGTGWQVTGTTGSMAIA